MNKLFIILFLPVCIFGQTISSKENGDWKTLGQSNYSIQYPPTWELNESGYLGTSFIILSPLELDQDKFMENVNLLIQDLDDKSMDLDKYTELSESQINTMVINYNLIESKRIKNESNEYHNIIYLGNQEDLKLKYEQY